MKYWIAAFAFLALLMTAATIVPADVDVARQLSRFDQDLNASPSVRSAPKSPPLSRQQLDDINEQTELRAFFEQQNVPPCFALSGLFAFKSNGIVLMYPNAVASKMSFSSVEVPGVGRVVTLEDDNCRIRLQVSFDSLPNKGGSDAPR